MDEQALNRMIWEEVKIKLDYLHETLPERADEYYRPKKIINEFLRDMEKAVRF